jgi:beta-glucosidase-like glycosyl hydrolase
VTGSTTVNLVPQPTAVRDQLAQLLVVRIGSNLPPVRTVDEDAQRMAELQAACPVGGLLLFNGGASTRATLDQLQRGSAIPLLVAADVERGVGQQVRGSALFPHAMAFGRLASDAAAAVSRFARFTAEEARAAGIHIAMAPVADVSTNPRNPIISIRAFSEDARSAAELVASYVASAESAGLLTTAKHFPGHGDTQQDSHDSLPVVPKSLDELRECELLPFGAAIDAGCSAVMTAHVAFPQVDPSGLPATLSPNLIEQLLRTEMGFNGVVISDSLLMAGVRDRFATEGELARAALAAGVDLLLDVADPVAVVDHLAACIADGSLDRRRVDEALGRVLALKQRAFGPAPDVSASNSQAGEVARRAVEIVAGNRANRPLDPGRPLAAILLKPFASPLDPPEQPLADALRRQFREVQYVELGPDAVADQLAAAGELARGADQLLLAMIARPAAWHAFGLLPSQREFVRRITSERAAVVVSLGVPHVLADFPDAAVAVCTYSDVAVSQQALAQFLVANR